MTHERFFITRSPLPLQIKHRRYCLLSMNAVVTSPAFESWIPRYVLQVEPATWPADCHVSVPEMKACRRIFVNIALWVCLTFDGNFKFSGTKCSAFLAGSKIGWKQIGGFSSFLWILRNILRTQIFPKGEQRRLITYGQILSADFKFWPSKWQSATVTKRTDYSSVKR